MLIPTTVPLDPTLEALADLSISANSLTIGTGADAFIQIVFAANTFPARASTGDLVAKVITDYGLSLLDDADAAAARTTLGLGTAATQDSTAFQPIDSDLTAIAALATTSYGRALLTLADAGAARTALGLGTVATHDATEFQPIDSDLTAIAALSTTAYGRTLLTLADAAALRTAAALGTAALLNSDTDTDLSANSDSNVATQRAVKAYVDTVATGILRFRGDTDCSTNPNYPLAIKGDVYVVSVAGKIGGASGIAVDIGDAYAASATNVGGTQAAVGASWFILEHNLQGALLAANNLSDVASVPAARTSLGLGTAATQDSTAFDAAGAAAAAQAASQPLDSDLTAFAGLAVDTDKLPYGTGSHTLGLTDFTAAARTVLDDATVAAMVDTLGGASSTGSGGLVRVISPTLTTPVLGAATATSINGNTITAGTGTLTLSTFTLTAANTGTVGTLENAQTWSAAQTFSGTAPVVVKPTTAGNLAVNINRSSSSTTGGQFGIDTASNLMIGCNNGDLVLNPTSGYTNFGSGGFLTSSGVVRVSNLSRIGGIADLTIDGVGDNIVFKQSGTTYVTIDSAGQATFAAGTITTSKPLTITQTWNDGSVTFNSLLVNVTATASAAASLLMDLQVAGTSKLNVTKAGKIVVTATSQNSSIIASGSENTGFAFQGGNNNKVAFVSSGTCVAGFGAVATGLVAYSDCSYGWSSVASSTGWFGAYDTGLSRSTAGVVEVNNGTIGTFRDLKLRTATHQYDAIAATSTDGLILSNTTAAISGTQQWSPRLRWIGQGFGGSTSQTCDWIAELQPVQGGTNPVSRLAFSSQVNSGGYTERIAVCLQSGSSPAGLYCAGSFGLFQGTNSGWRLTAGGSGPTVPVYAFQNDNTTGMGTSTNGGHTITFTVSGAEVARFAATVFTLGSSLDIGFVNSSANNVGITNGGATTYATIGAGGLIVSGVPAGTKKIIAKADATGADNAFEAQNSSGTAYVTVGPPTLTGSSTTSNFLNVTGTFPSSLAARTVGCYQVYTTAGSSSQQIQGMRLELNAGYTGSKDNYVLIAVNSVAGTGSDVVGGVGNFGLYGASRATTTGFNAGVYSDASGGNVNAGFISQALTAKNSATNIGVGGFALNTGSSPIQVGGYFGLQNATPTFASAALMCDDGGTTSPMFVARNNGTPIITCTGALTGSSTTSNFLNVTGTFTTGGTIANAVLVSVTGAGVALPELRALAVDIPSGYTGSGFSVAGNFTNSATSTGTDWLGGVGNAGIFCRADGTTAGSNVGFFGVARNGNVNVAVAAKATTNKNSAANVAVAGIALNTGSSPVQIGGYFGLQSTTPTFAASAALMCDNGSQTSDIFVCRDNGTAVLTVADGGTITASGAYEGASYIAYKPSGTYKITLGSGSTMNLASDMEVAFSSTTATTGSKDIGYARNAAGVLEINNGTQGVFASLISGVHTVNPPARTSGVAPYFQLITPPDTAQTASTEAIGAQFGGTNANPPVTVTRQYATGALTTHRENLFTPPTIAFVGASTCTTAVTAEFASPIQGTNATLTNSYAGRFIASAATHVPLVVKGAGSQTGSLLSVQASDGTVQSVFTAGGALRFDNVTGSGFGTAGITSAINIATGKNIAFTDNNQFTKGGFLNSRMDFTYTGPYGYMYLTNAIGSATTIGQLRIGAVTTANFQNGATANVSLFSFGDDGFLGINTTAATAQLHIAQAVQTSGSPTALNVVGGAHTTLAASTEDIYANFNNSATIQFATGAYAGSMRSTLFQAPTYNTVGSSSWAGATCATVAINAAPTIGGNITGSPGTLALWVQSGVLQFSNITNSRVGRISEDANFFQIDGPGASGIALGYGGTAKVIVQNPNQLIPNADNTMAFGTSGQRWASTDTVILNVRQASTSAVGANFIAVASRAAALANFQTSAAGSLGNVSGGCVGDVFADVSTTHTDGTFDTLRTDTLVANALIVNGDKIYFDYTLTIVSHGSNTGDFKLAFAGITIFDSGAVTFSSTGTVRIFGYIIRATSTTCRATISYAVTGPLTASASTTYVPEATLTSLTLTGTNNLVLSAAAAGSGAASGDVKLVQGTVAINGFGS